MGAFISASAESSGCGVNNGSGEHKMALTPKEKEELNKRNSEWLAKRKGQRGYRGEAWKETIKRLHNQYYGDKSAAKEAIQAAKDAGVDERKLEGKSMGKAQKLAAKELGVRCFNAMTRVELEEAINLATKTRALSADATKEELEANTFDIRRLEEIQAAARERTKARFAAIKAKKEQKNEG